MNISRPAPPTRKPALGVTAESRRGGNQACGPADLNDQAAVRPVTRSGSAAAGIGRGSAPSARPAPGGRPPAGPPGCPRRCWGRRYSRTRPRPAIVRVISTARCWASGDSETIRSKEVSSRSSKLLARCAADVDADLVHHGDREAVDLAAANADRIDEDAPAMQMLQHALGHRRAEAFSVQQNRTLPGSSAIGRP